MTFLEKIINFKQEEVNAQSKIIPLQKLKDSQRLFNVRNFKESLINNNISIIAEIKRKSPSENNIFLEANPIEVAKTYEKNGASAISVLTDNNFFGGQLDFINLVKSVVNIPVLRKDFIISEYQVWESFYIGADAILLIADAIDYELLSSLNSLASELGMHVLLETHDIKNIKKIKSLNPEIIGINCRNLKTMETHLDWFTDAINDLPPNIIKVAESGIYLNSHLKEIEHLGYNAALIGSSLMKTKAPGNALAKLLNRSPK